ncbi:pseudaminic acid cytidylyltransferase, partial [bacterium]|nr:pseudaminic acid cytidylyltransferase [bacterium]
IFATAPLITSDDIDEGKNVLEITGADLALAVTEFRSAPQRAQYVDDNGYLQYEYPENYSVRTQDLKNMYHDAAQFVWGKSSSFLAPVTDLNIAPVRIAAERVIDIDTVEDWNYAEYLYLAHHNRNLKLVG